MPGQTKKIFCLARISHIYKLFVEPIFSKSVAFGIKPPDLLLGTGRKNNPANFEGAIMPDLVVFPYGSFDRWARLCSAFVVGLIAFYGFR